MLLPVGEDEGGTRRCAAHDLLCPWRSARERAGEREEEDDVAAVGFESNG